MCWKMLMLSCIFNILLQRQFHLQELQGRLCLWVQRGGSSTHRPFVLLSSSCQRSEIAGAAPALLHGHPCSGVLYSLNNSCFPLQAMKWDPLMSQATSGKLGSTARAGKQRHLQLSAAISINMPVLIQLFGYVSACGLKSSETLAVPDLPDLGTVRMSAQLFAGWCALSWMEIIL